MVPYTIRLQESLHDDKIMEAKRKLFFIWGRILRGSLFSNGIEEKLFKKFVGLDLDNMIKYNVNR